MDITIIENEGLTAQGKRELIKHLSGEQISLRQSVKAKCYDCMGYYTDGKKDCGIKTCPLYPWMAFKEGGIQKKRNRVLSEEHIKKLIAGRKKLRLKKKNA